MGLSNIFNRMTGALIASEPVVIQDVTISSRMYTSTMPVLSMHCEKEKSALIMLKAYLDFCASVVLAGYADIDKVDEHALITFTSYFINREDKVTFVEVNLIISKDDVEEVVFNLQQCVDNCYTIVKDVGLYPKYRMCCCEDTAMFLRGCTGNELSECLMDKYLSMCPWDEMVYKLPYDVKEVQLAQRKTENSVKIHVNLKLNTFGREGRELALYVVNDKGVLANLASVYATNYISWSKVYTNFERPVVSYETCKLSKDGTVKFVFNVNEFEEVTDNV